MWRPVEIHHEQTMLNGKHHRWPAMEKQNLERGLLNVTMGQLWNSDASDAAQAMEQYQWLTY